MPKVTVIMPVFNTGRSYLKAAVDSVKRQTYQDWELVLYDDGSDPDYLPAIRQVTDGDARIHVMYHTKNHGAGYARNACIRASAGKYVALMDADDISAPDRLQEQVDFLDMHPEYAFVGSNAWMIDDYGIWGRRILEKEPGKSSFLKTLPFIHPSVMVRRDVWNAVQGYSEKKRDYRVEDYEWMMRLYAAGYRGYNIQKMLFYYREDSRSYKKRKYRYRIDECRMRYVGFRNLGILQGHIHYVLKPLATGLVPAGVMQRIKRIRYHVGTDFAGSADIPTSGDIKIFVSHTSGSSNVRVRAPMFCHVMAGSDFQHGEIPKDMLADNTGDHISNRNRFYCELTTQYWAWKNMDADYYGFCHYRRYFSFAPVRYAEDDCGCLVYPYLDKKIWKKLYPGEKEVYQKITRYDCLIAKGLPTGMLGAKNVYQHYSKAPGLEKRDLDLFLHIVCKRYPQLRSVVRSYINGNLFYPCNMFIMKKELFREYAQMLFSVLEEFQHDWDMAGYSGEGQRTPGHLGERFAGIYYEYLKQQGYHIGELQMALLEHTQKNICAQPLPQEIPIVLAADNSYMPVLFICLKSLTEHCSKERNYHIYIFHTDIGVENRQVFQSELACENIVIDFVDVSARMTGYDLKAKGHISGATFYRFLILDMFRECRKVIYLDADVIVCKDLALLYDLPLEDALLAAAVDADFIGQYHGANPDTRRYCQETLRLKNPDSYIQAGVLVLQVKELNKKTSAEKLLAMARKGDYRYSDQDILNIVCEGKIKILDLVWNVCTDSKGGRYPVIRQAPAGILEAYERARKRPCILHYAGDGKPWNDPRMDFANEFWRVARNTPYYETLLYQMQQKQHAQTGFGKKAAQRVKQILKSFLPQGSRVRRMAVRLYWKLK